MIKHYFKITIYLLVIAISCAPAAHAQTNAYRKIDSLLRKMESFKNDTDKVKCYNAIAGSYKYLNPDSGIIYAKLALEQATKLNYKKGAAWANILLGHNYYNKVMNNYHKPANSFDKSDYGKILEHYAIAEKMFGEIGDKTGLVSALGGISLFYIIQNEYEQALNYSFRILQLREETGDAREVWNTLANVGNIYRNLHKYNQALNYYNRAIAVAEKANENNLVIGFERNIGDVYFDSGAYDQALKHYFTSLQSTAGLQDKYIANKFSSVILMNISETYFAKKNYPQSIKYARQSGAKETENGETDQTGGVYYTIGECYLALSKLSHEQLAYLLSSDTSGVALNFNSKILLHKGIDQLEKALELYKKQNTISGIKRCHELLYPSYRSTGNLSKALESYQLFIAARDTFEATKNLKERFQLQLQYEFSKKSAVEREKIAAAANQKLLKARQIRYVSIGVTAFMVLLASVVLVAYRQKQKDNIALSKEKQRSERLLQNILPVDVANELKENQASKARNFNDVTVLFTDFVDFTKTAEVMSAQELVTELDVCFKAFDNIIDKYNIEKIKTIGDAYMAVSGLPKPSFNHASDIVQAAIEMQDFMNKRHKMLGDKTFRMRAGIHSGSVVAGIVGLKKFAYDIWGDTVNTAARMEQKSEAGKINISQTTYELVKDKFTCEYRGEVEVKGKGMMKMYFSSITDPKLPSA
jgi:adenylate cyclase